ncbi:MOSC N-terminal beta barrel [Penicillium alfredii]|uniref:MOSC N-terminal beta barrel n=1 Tax=Penicillium alfredii TaxID=1506179 RepID=A0A9W9FJZ0_9EURO|nr:MOSC N-terminal beta barrel [Penicillium alfredii]KAJ5101616.1 MOSC N-terminal beta barrel [Penicillium alfredii]
MLEAHSTLSAVVLALILLIPLIPTLIIPELKGWTNHNNPRRWLPPFSRLWRRTPRQSSEIVSLRMYPIKSCRGFEVQETTLREHGLDLDRRWMLVDAATNQFLTIRQIPNMTRITTALSADGEELVVRVPREINNHNNKTDIAIDIETEDVESEDMHTIRIPSHPTPTWLAANTTPAAVRIWDTDTDGYLYSAVINAPFSQFLGRPVALVYKGPAARILQGNGAPSQLGRVQTTGFPDVHPVLMASEASLAELNTRLRGAGLDPITVERFRPNIVVRGEKPWSEDSWKLVRIREESRCDSTPPSARAPLTIPLDLDILARCARCQVPNVDPVSARKHKKQPWDTLISYRRVDEGIKFKPCFGMLSAPRQEGVVRVGMKVDVLEETKDHRYITGF